ncbi:VWA domain-containing protein [Stutzerimonas stutzeri]|uniref:VWA domain-containing protein n=1 Tax=Stutzerimonas sp. S1 TaxID=3030652 RepID=UPI0022258EF3|nr:VWA domain-containing protein [Stutzerimonas sp. S1]MCW3148811.1 VWA domain-containing protein [Stutzerimonas sp. S1]
MNAFWPQLLRPFWLLIVPLLLWLLWRLWHRQRQIGRWQRLLPEAFHAELLTRGRLRNSRLPWVALGLAWLLTCLALLGPSWQRLEQPSLKRADPLVVLLEVTPAMLAADTPPTRLEHAKRKLLDLLESRPDAQTSVVVFAGSAHTLVPLSDDLATTTNLLNALSPALMPEPGQRADLAVAQGLALLEQGAQGRGRLLLMTAAVGDTEQRAILELLGERNAQLSILGIGTEQGAPIAGEDGSFLKDAHGAILIPRLDNAGLRRFAAELGGRYQQSRVDDADLQNLGLLDAAGSTLTLDETTRLDTWLDQGYWLLLPLLLLAACAGRRGWLFCLPLLLLQTPPASALEFDDLWLRPDQQGQRLLDAQRPAQAAERFQDPRWQGIALYRAGDYAAAAERFAKGDGAADHYNRGNALARSEQLEAALEAYEQALERQPDLEPAQRNKALVEELLRQRQQQSRQDEQPAGEEPSPKPSEQVPPNPQTGPAQVPPPDSTTQQTPASPANREGPGDEPQSAEPQPAQASDQAPAAAALEDLPTAERHQAMEQWLRQIPDNPGELLRRKFLYEQRKRQELNR